MLNKMLAHFGYTKTSTELSRLLAEPSLREEFLGVAPVDLPTPDKIQNDTAKLVQHAQTPAYKVFAKEVWARALGHLDAVLDPATSGEKLQFHRGALRASLDLLRISHQAQAAHEQLAKDEQEKPGLSAANW